MEGTETSTIFAPLVTVKCVYKFNERTGLPGINLNHRRLKDGIIRNGRIEEHSLGNISKRPWPLLLGGFYILT
jgi:hypothetical protein